MMHLQPKHTTEKMMGHAMMGSYSAADEDATIISKDWTHLNLSMNSEEIMPSPFDDIGFLATDNAPSRSINMKGSSSPWDDNNTCNGKTEPANKSIGTAPSLHDFLQKEKQSISQQLQQKSAVHNDIVSRGASKLPFRRGKRNAGVSKRGDIECYSPHKHDFEWVVASVLLVFLLLES